MALLKNHSLVKQWFQDIVKLREEMSVMALQIFDPN